MPSRANIIDLELKVKRAGIKIIHPLENAWILWRRDPGDKDFRTICKFSSAEGFAVFLNNMSFHKNIRYTIMKEGITPIWESIHHRNGGYFTLDLGKKSSDDNCKKIIADFLRGLVGGQLCDRELISNLTGITFVSDDSVKQCRFWAKDLEKKIYFKDISDNYKITITDSFKSDGLDPNKIEFIHSSFIKITNVKSSLANQYHSSIVNTSNQFSDVDSSDFGGKQSDYWRERKNEKKLKNLQLTRPVANNLQSPTETAQSPTETAQSPTETAQTATETTKSATETAQSATETAQSATETHTSPTLSEIETLEKATELKKSGSIKNTSWLYMNLSEIKDILLGAK